MRGLAVDQAGELTLVDLREPVAGDGQVVLRTQRVGICATDREMVRSRSIYTIPEGEPYLVLGHEAVGVVEEVGPGVQALAPGDVVVPVAYVGEHRHTVGRVEADCHIDMCPYGLERRRGINDHGFFRDYLLEDAGALVKAPEDVAGVAMLLEPLTVTLKGLGLAHRERQKWLDLASPLPVEDFPQKTLVIGAGPIGLLGIVLARTYGWPVVVLDIAPPDSPKARITTEVGAHYVDGRSVLPEEIRSEFGEFDIVLDAVQDPRVFFDYTTLLAQNGVFVLIGWMAGAREGLIDLAAHVRGLLDKHATVVASVGAGKRHYVDGMGRLAQMRARYGDVLERMVTGAYPLERFHEGFDAAGPSEIKTVLEF